MEDDEFWEQFRPERKWHRRKGQPDPRYTVLTHYGGGKLACVRCGFQDIRALTIDHINGNGTEERKKHGKTGISFYWKLIDDRFPPGYQTLCMNCQWIKARENREYRGWKSKYKIIQT